MSKPSNPQLYSRVKSQAKRKFRVWPSAYGSAWLVKEYKKRGGTYSTSQKSPRRKRSQRRSQRKRSRRRSQRKRSRRRTQRKRSRRQGGLTRWFDEKWINVCKLPKKVQCGRPSAGTKISEWKRDYPYCRPSRRVNNKSPVAAGSLTRSEIKRRCSRKRRSPRRKVFI